MILEHAFEYETWYLIKIYVGIIEYTYQHMSQTHTVRKRNTNILRLIST